MLGHQRTPELLWKGVRLRRPSTAYGDSAFLNNALLCLNEDSLANFSSSAGLSGGIGYAAWHAHTAVAVWRAGLGGVGVNVAHVKRLQGEQWSLL